MNQALDRLTKGVQDAPDSNWMLSISQAVKQGATLGEISDTLRQALYFEVIY